MNFKNKKIEIEKQYNVLVEKYNITNKNINLIKDEILRLNGMLRLINSELNSELEKGKELKLKKTIEVKEGIIKAEWKNNEW